MINPFKSFLTHGPLLFYFIQTEVGLRNCWFDNMFIACL